MHTHRFRAGFLGIAAAASLVLPSHLVAQASVSTDSKASAVDTTDRAYVELLTKAHNDEIEAGRNALASTRNEKVRDFAQKLVDDHTKALDKLSPIASRMGMSNIASVTGVPSMDDQPPSAARDTTLPRPEEGMGAMGDSAKGRITPTASDSMKPAAEAPGDSASRLSPSTTPQTDRQFIDAMVVNHQQLLGKLPEGGRGIKDKELRSYVSDVRKSVQRHFTMARDIQTKMGGREK
jgi:predicted outer membrane protein